MKIFVRERTKGQEGSRNPRFRIVATAGGDLNVQVPHMRKVDIETIANDLGAEVVYLPGREHVGKKEKEGKEQRRK